MNSVTDQQLLRDYTERRSETAFAELVHRHVDFVYSSALRMVHDAHLAEDVTQDVFVALAQNARKLAGRAVLSGWLHRTARNLAANAVRSDVRRRVREQKAATMHELLSPAPGDSWENVAPQLDAALGELSESDRDAVLLRYFERKSAQEMAHILGLSDEAAQKRVNRAVERLRDHFSKRNVAIGTSGLAVVISANAVQAAPVGLATTISANAALAETAVHTSTLISAAKMIAMNTIQKTVITAALALVAGAGIYEARQATQLREQNRTLQQRQAAMTEQIRQLQRDRNEVASLSAENQQLKSGQNTKELLKLRGEVGQLRQQLQGLPSARVALLKHKLEEMPDKAIPELKLLTDKDWRNVAATADLDTDDGVRVALSKLRNKAVDTFLNLTRTALIEYLAANNATLPANLLPLAPYYSTPVTDALLQRYAFTQTGQLSTDLNETVVRETAAGVDDDYDSRSEMSMTGAGASLWNNVQSAINNAVMAFAKDNNGQIPGDPAQITPYLNRPIDAVTMQNYFDQATADLAAKLPPAVATTVAPALKAYTAANNGQFPQSLLDLLPYVTTPEQQATLQKLYQYISPPK